MRLGLITSHCLGKESALLAGLEKAAQIERMKQLTEIFWVSNLSLQVYDTGRSSAQGSRVKPSKLALELALR